jgi:hypothetical protein
MIMFKEITQIQPENGSMYRMRLLGALNSPTIEWVGEITVMPQEHSGILLVSLLIDTDALHGFLDQFHDLSLTIVPNEGTENENLPFVNPR